MNGGPGASNMRGAPHHHVLDDLGEGGDCGDEPFVAENELSTKGLVHSHVPYATSMLSLLRVSGFNSDSEDFLMSF